MGAHGRRRALATDKIGTEGFGGRESRPRRLHGRPRRAGHRVGGTKSGYVLAIDQGTTSSRAIVFDANQQIAGIGRMEFTQHFPASGWVEHVPDEIWATCLWSVKTALKTAGVKAADIAAIGNTF